MESKDVPLDEVGNVEAVLNRLVQERRSLEAGVSVMQTYRMVKSQLQPAVEELAALQAQVESVKKELAGLKETQKVAMANLKEELRLSAEREKGVVQGDVDRLYAVRDRLVEEVEIYTKMAEQAKLDHETQMERQEESYRLVQSELMEMKVQHAALAEAIGKAAAFFKQ